MNTPAAAFDMAASHITAATALPCHPAPPGPGDGAPPWPTTPPTSTGQLRRRPAPPPGRERAKGGADTPRHQSRRRKTHHCGPSPRAAHPQAPARKRTLSKARTGVGGVAEEDVSSELVTVVDD